MTHTRWIALAILAITLAACSPAPVSTPMPVVPTAAPVKSLSPSSSSAVASGVIVPAQSVRLGFTLVGQVKTVDVTLGDVVQADQTLITLDTSVLDARVAEAEAALNATQVQYNYLKRVGTAREHLESAQADVDRAQAVLDSTLATLAQAMLVTPINGTVASLDVTPGETVVPGQIVVVLGDLTRLQVETTDLSEQDVPRVKVGQPARIYVEALDQEITGKVIDIAQQATTVGGDVVYKVTIALDEQLQDLRWGMSVEVEIKTDA